MTAEIIIPPLGESIQEATIANISKKVGDSVDVDELILELETDKVTLEVNAPEAGVISELTVAVGDTVRVAQVIGRIAKSTKPVEKSEKPVASCAVSNAPKVAISEPILAPSAQRIVTENNLDASKIQGTGKDGRVMKEDALNATCKVESKPTTLPTNRGETVVKMTKLRQTIAKRLKESQNTAAILTTFNEVDMSAVMQFRKEYQDVFVKKYGIKLGFMSFFTKAAAVALQEIPAVNAEIRENEIVYKNYCDIGVAVGTDQGLVVPILRNTEKMNFADIEKAIYNYGLKAKEGKITMEDLKGGTFTISNGGTYGSLLSTPIINPPQSGILGMHNIVERPVVVNGQIVIRPMMYIALSYDHRIIDGKEAVTFLVRIKQLVEDPRRLVLEI